MSSGIMGTANIYFRENAKLLKIKSQYSVGLTNYAVERRAKTLVFHPVAYRSELLFEIDKDLDDLGIEVRPARIDDDVRALFILELGGV
jgi:hypothetical protein